MTRNCRMELCRYWPGEGCMAGVMPCDADEPGPDQDRPDAWYEDDPDEGYEFRSDGSPA